VLCLLAIEPRASVGQPVTLQRLTGLGLTGLGLTGLGLTGLGRLASLARLCRREGRLRRGK
jgi:hypothetical protein